MQRLGCIYPERLLNNDETLPPMRLSGYKFRPDDFEIYVRHRADLLESPRGRAALLRGGIVARIAREHIELASATRGPSSAITVHRLGMHITDKTGAQFWDDDLTENEIGVICGLHRCFTGRGTEVVLVSWWPMPSQWDSIKACGYNWGHWTQCDEEWYLNRRRIIAASGKDGIPLSATAWRINLRGAGTAREANKRVLEFSKKLF
ncbi:hypothetical protein M413DRAFT_78557 [Hebeloma cylindrosporum]|uniref:Uncharacterized protein n=1 Tax=Hebeloma cylindrosporum TaxID=76867 RepID=A0A0C3BXK7_HEBCY|nr:hypothetical protein M413DRAFT_78557 [Hebeloma cylindrosporum h7]